MKLVALIGSPRKGGNTDLLVREILKACKDEGHSGEAVRLYDHEIRSCIDCRKCKKGELLCPVDDGMQEIYPRLDAADLLVFATPLYWFGPSAKMKLLIDRLRPYVASKKLAGKRAAVLTPAADGPAACRPLVEMFRLTFDYLGMEYRGELLVTAYERGEVKKNPADLKRAYEFGVEILK